MSGAAPHPSAGWRSRDREAQLLAELLRVSRLTVLVGEAGSGKTALLRIGVLPLLRRRAADRRAAPTTRSARVVVPFPERRGQDSLASGAEVAVYFDHWGEAPAAALQARVAAALPLGRPGEAPPAAADSLPDSLAAWNAALGVRFLIMLDRFEQFLAAPPEQPGVREFTDALVATVNRSMLPVSFLVSVRADAEPLIDRFLRQRLPGFGDARLRLPALHRAGARLPEAVPPVQTFRRRTPAPAGTERTGVPAITSFDRMGPAQPSAAPLAADPARADAARADAAAPAAARPPDPAHVPLAKTPVSTARTRRAWAPVWIAAPVAAALLLALAVTMTTRTPSAPAQTAARAPGDAPGTTAPAATPAAAAPPVATAAARLPSAAEPPGPPGPPATIAPAGIVAPVVLTVAAPRTDAAQPLPRVELAVDAGSDTDLRIARDLARTVAADAGFELGVYAEVPFERDRAPTLPLAIARHDVLGASSSARAAADKQGLRVVAPLYTEEIHVFVRSDTTMSFLHELRPARINLGPASSGRRQTAALLYEQMFGVPVPAAQASFLDDRQALQRLVHERSLDAVVVVAGQPARWLAELPPETARSIKLLRLDIRHPASQKAIESYLPTMLRAAHYPAWLGEDTPTLAAMSFLVTAGGAADPAAAERLRTFARSLCRSLPTLRRDGHPKWREVQPELQLDVGWSYAAAATDGLRSCQPDRTVQAQAGGRP